MMQKSDQNLIHITANTPTENINTGYDRTLQRTITDGVIYIGVSQNNYWLGENAGRYIDSIAVGSVTYKTSDASYGMGYGVKVKPNTKYSVSFNNDSGKVGTRIAEYDSAGNWVQGTNKVTSDIPYTFTTTATTDKLLFIFTVSSTSYLNQLVTVSNIVVEETT